MHIKQIWLTVSLLTYGAICFSQVTGKIVDESNIALEYATAAIFNQFDKTLITGVITDLEGNFTLTDIKNGTYYLEVSFIGYDITTIRDIVIEKNYDKKDVGIVQLSLGNLLNEVVVKAEHASVVNKIDRQVYTTKRFKNAQGGSGVDVIRNLPSVTIDGLGEISVRGSTGFIVLLNGKPIQGNASLLMASLPANAIERVEVITAPSAKYDPEGKAGILNIITKKGAANGAFGQLNIKGGLPSIENYGNDKTHQRHGIDATYYVKNDKWNFAFSGNYQRNDLGGRREGDVFTIINDVKTQFPSTGERSSNEVNYSGRATIDYSPDSTSVFSFGFFAGKRSNERLADIVYSDNHGISPANSNNRIYTFQYYNHNTRERKSDFAIGSLDYEHTFKNTSKLSTSFLYEYTLLGGPTVNQNLGFPDNSILYQDEFNTNTNPLNGVRFLLDYRFNALKLGVFETGYQYRNLDHKGDFVYERRPRFEDDFVLVPEFSSEVNLKRSIHSFYTQFTGQKGKWDYAAGARVEITNRTFELKDKANTVDETFKLDFTKLYPSTSLLYSINDNTNIKAAYSKRVERTTTFKMNPFPEREHSETLEQGDPELKPEFIDLLELGVTKKIEGGNSIFATAYYRNVKNLVNRVNTVFNDTILNRIYSNVGNAKAIGLEIGAQFKPLKNWGNFIGANIYNYSIDGTFDDRKVDSKATVYSINLNSTYTFWDNASLQFTFNYLSEKVTAQGEDSRFYSPNLTLQKSFLNNRLTATFQWQNIDMGLLDTNEQRITTVKPDEFFTTTNYIYEVDIVLLNLSFIFKNGKNKTKFIDSEFGKREF
ncbi:outer membrane receptor protein involved in Fe transport [Maribacter spongiicola]|uniref:Outer membrane receptor protein involved in Fe transport n=1 Tax=Maribacter spongiicola TaxID=1206753 RepID=A0A4R7K9F1_9FLAO|nr:TonB-dependent receptor [Maribacter spongiicola]TDT47342.1 outer membrane receptor protein involved in Fe transport [Maribacter spongiicola]